MATRLLAGAHLGAIIAVWLVAWIPMALFCAAAALFGGLRGHSKGVAL